MEIGLLFHEVGIDRFLRVGLRVALHFASFHGISFSLLQTPPLILWFSLIELKGFGTNSTVDLSITTDAPPANLQYHENVFVGLSVSSERPQVHSSAKTADSLSPYLESMR